MSRGLAGLATPNALGSECWRRAICIAARTQILQAAPLPDDLDHRAHGWKTATYNSTREVS